MRVTSMRIHVGGQPRTQRTPGTSRNNINQMGAWAGNQSTHVGRQRRAGERAS